MLLCSPDWSFTGPGQARQADFGRTWRGMVGEQTREPVSTAEEAGMQVARRHAWVGALALVKCQQSHFLTVAIHKQASQQPCSDLGEWRIGLGADFTAHTTKGGGDVREGSYVNTCIKHETHSLSHKHANKDLFLSRSLSSHTCAHLHWSSSVAQGRQGSTRANKACLGCWLNIAARNSTGVVCGWEITGRISVVFNQQQAVTMPCSRLRSTMPRGVIKVLGSTS